MEKSGGGTAAAPTGCYKCGRPGHWSRDCPSDPTAASNNSDPNNTRTSYNNNYPKTTSHPFKKNTAEKPKKVPRSRPKLTPEMLLSDQGLGLVLRHFPRAFKYHGRGHEVSDLGNLLGLYAEWHKQLIPYYSFDQFVHKVEKVGSTKRVKMCIKDLRDRVASGVDPSKLHEPPGQQEIASDEQDVINLEEPSTFQEDASLKNPDDFQENMLQEVWDKATEEQSQPMHQETVAGDTSSCVKEPPSEARDNTSSSSKVIQISEDQKARMEANRLKALERAAARAQSQSARTT